MQRLTRLCLIFTAFVVLAGSAVADTWFGELQQGGTMNGFAVKNVYLNGKDQPMGARLIHLKTGFTMDMFQLQSDPQAFMWVNTPPEDDMGEPHTCEHLLLGKGSKGQYVASLEDMSLGSSTAYTSQLYTAYPFSSGGGNDIFFVLLKEKLDALLHPNFTDEEIRREVCNIGVSEDPSTGALSLDEKGTVYTEMVSTYEKHWYHLYSALDEMVYGTDHPMSNVSGGRPDDIRKMTPADLRAFHDKRYQLNNMGMIVTIPSDITPETMLSESNAILLALDRSVEEGNIPPAKVIIPPPQPSVKPGEIRVTYYPGANEQEPGNIAFYWPADLDLSLDEETLLGIFMYCLGGSQTSNLYNKFINSDTRVTDIGANWVWAGVDDNIGHVVSIGISNVSPEFINKTKIASLKKMIKEEIAAVSAYKPGSAELKDFNDRARSYLTQRIKSTENYLNSPPGFGLRGGGGGGWYGLMKELEKVDGFKKSMVLKDTYNKVLTELDQDNNIWTALISKCGLASKDIYAAGCKADPSLQAKAQEEKQARLAAFTEELKAKYAVADNATAIADYKKDYDANTLVIEEESAKIPMPKFLDNPPLTYDDMLDYKVLTIDGSVPLVASTFGSMTSATIGLACDLHSIPESKLLYVPLLGDLITEIGVVKNGETVTFAAMSERLKNEVLGLNGYVSANPTTGRVELVVTGSGSNPVENDRAIEWMTAGLFSPYLDAANLPRLRDVVKSNLQGLRNRMKGSEEGWVTDPANSYLYQTDPLLLAGYSFLTQEHFMHRIKWRLMDAGGGESSEQAVQLFESLASAGESLKRDKLSNFATSFPTADPASFTRSPFAAFAAAYIDAAPEAQDAALEALNDLAEILPSLPDESCGADWAYLVRQMKNDLLYAPENVLADLTETLALARHKDNVRMYIISNEADRAALMSKIGNLVARMDAAASTPAVYSHAPRIKERMKSRYPSLADPTYVGLINTNTRNGVFIYTAGCANLATTDKDSLLDYVAARLYGGGGAHSMFMKTWSAGLAYSNGLRSSETSGRVIYYAERCPDLATTMRFVVDELKKAPNDPKLAEYAIAQAFVGNRGSNSYESRGATMAANLADGITPETVAAFRKRILDLRSTPNLYEELSKRMEKIYGSVLIGYGDSLENNRDGNYFVIGPPEQFDHLAEYIATAEKPQPIYRMYPRDYWIVD